MPDPSAWADRLFELDPSGRLSGRIMACDVSTSHVWDASADRDPSRPGCEVTVSERPDERPDGQEQHERPDPARDASYPGRLDERMLTPSAPLPPGAGIRVFPVGIEPFVTGSTPPVWAPDPTGRHQWRWWGGVAWTDHVADDGIVGEDPLDPG